MADTKISALTGATTPLAGTEVVPIVQGGQTRKVSVADLTASRAISATELTLTTGNLIVGSGQGIDFSATPGTGTSELLSDYEEGTWSPTVVSTAGSITSYTASGTYTKIGRVVELNVDISITDNGTGSGQLDVSNLPFAPIAAYSAVGSFAERGAVGFGGYLYVVTTAQLFLASSVGAYPGGTGYRIVGSISYPT